MVASLTCTPVSASNISAARSNGIQASRRVRWSWDWGLRLPGSNPSSSSRGKKPGPTGRAGAIAAREFQVVSPRALQVTTPVPARLQSRSTVGTPWPCVRRLAAPLRRGTAQGQLLDHARRQAAHPLDDGFFNLAQGRLRVPLPPFFHATEHLFAQSSPCGLRLFCHVHALHLVMAPSYHLCSALPTLSAKT